MNAQDNSSKNEHYQLARDYLSAVTAGELPDDLLTEDMTGWITTSGSMSKKKYQFLVRMLKAMCKTPIHFTVHSLTADEDRVVIEAESVCTLINEEEYRNAYIFVLRIRNGKIASIAEHYNALVAKEKLVPLMEEASEKLALGS